MYTGIEQQWKKPQRQTPLLSIKNWNHYCPHGPWGSIPPHRTWHWTWHRTWHQTGEYPPPNPQDSVNGMAWAEHLWRSRWRSFLLLFLFGLCFLMQRQLIDSKLKIYSLKPQHSIGHWVLPLHEVIFCI